MSDDRSHPESNEENFEELAEIEAALEKISPSQMSVGFLAELERDLQNVEAVKASQRPNISYVRFATMAAAACVLLGGFIAMQLGAFSDSPAVSEAPAEVVLVDDAEEIDPDLIHGLPPRNAGDRFQEISRQQYLRNASVGGVVELDNDGGFAREVTLDILEADELFDEESQSTVQRYRTYQGVILEPVQPE